MLPRTIREWFGIKAKIYNTNCQKIVDSVMGMLKKINNLCYKSIKFLC